jgi:formylglycine-generating enzyme required for sulfatase activity
MKTIAYFIRPLVLTLLALASSTTSTLAQTVSIPDQGLNAAIRDTLHIPSAPLTVQDLLTLTNLDASRRNVRATVGLETASNLVSLNLQINLLTNFPIPTTFTKLAVLDVSANPLTNFSVPSFVTNLASLTIEGCSLTNVTLPPTLTALTNFDIEGNNVRNFNLPATLTSLVSLDLGFNLFTSFSLPAGLTNLSTFYFAGNPLTNATFPAGMSGMTELNLSQNLLTSFTLPTGMTNLEELDLAFNQLTNVTLPDDLRNLSELDLDFNRFSNLHFPSNLTSLKLLHLRANLFTNFNLSAGLVALTYLDVSDGPLRAISLPADLNHLTTLRIAGNTNLTSLFLPGGMTNLTSLFLVNNRLTNVVLPSDLNRLQTLDLGGNQLASLTLPPGLTNLTGLFVVGNLLTSLTLPPDLTNLVTLSFLANPLTTFILSEPLAASTNLTVNLTTIASLRNQGISVFTYPLAVRLLSPRRTLIGAFELTLTGPPGLYSVLGSADLSTWHEVGIATNGVGSIGFTDLTTILSQRRFYRARLQSSPANMVFISPNTFTMGSPTNELDRATDEGPQTTVILTRGFWIGKYEVTQGEYLSVMNTNPSPFPGDLSRPVTSVSWPDATNYCAKLTQTEVAAGRISAGSQYRLPTEAEWECAARAGTSTRFSYGDDPGYTNLADHAWYASNSGFMPHPVGQKLPNPWGLYDMEGNAVEWCQDWFGLLPGGVQTDPTGPPTSTSGRKVTRGGAFDNTQQSCRSAERSLFNAGPLDTDTDLGFRVVLVEGSQ